jgi:hypothetical protein
MEFLSYCHSVRIKSLFIKVSVITVGILLSLPVHLVLCNREGHVEILQHFLDVFPDIWDTVSNNGRTPLHTAGIKI